MRKEQICRVVIGLLLAALAAALTDPTARARLRDAAPELLRNAVTQLGLSSS